MADGGCETRVANVVAPLETGSTGSDDKVRYIFMGVALVFATFSFFVVVLMCYLSCRQRRELRAAQQAEADEVRRVLREADAAIRDPETGEIDISFHPDVNHPEFSARPSSHFNQPLQRVAVHGGISTARSTQLGTLLRDASGHSRDGGNLSLRNARLERGNSSSGVSLSAIDQAFPPITRSELRLVSLVEKEAAQDERRASVGSACDEKRLWGVKYTEAELCAICLEPYSVREAFRQLACGHVFHSDCIVRWLSRANRCPLCNNCAVPSADR
mmetsp:Transcript_2000/g.5303  ORF Transcript_2000/g.5303 Transcript_2000/m.5303 type:complete len:273 (-) Transcript_2000:315-1133(-)